MSPKGDREVFRRASLFSDRLAVAAVSFLRLFSFAIGGRSFQRLFSFAIGGRSLCVRGGFASVFSCSRRSTVTALQN